MRDFFPLKPYDIPSKDVIFSLTIPLGFTIVMTLYIAPLMVTGPSSDDFNCSMAGSCAINGWINLLYLNNVLEMFERVSLLHNMIYIRLTDQTSMFF